MLLSFEKGEMGVPEAAKRLRLGWKQVWGKKGLRGAGGACVFSLFFGAAQFTAARLTSPFPSRTGDTEGSPPLSQGLPHPYIAELDR